LHLATRGFDRPEIRAEIDPSGRYYERLWQQINDNDFCLPATVKIAGSSHKNTFG
jgi:hypothetical protein